MRINWTVLIGFMALMVFSVSSAYADDWKKIEKQGFSFEYPPDWTYNDMGSDDFEGMTGYTMALGAPGGIQASVVVMVFPNFSLDLEGAGFTFGDFAKLVLESFLQEEKTTGAKIDTSECEMSHGKVDSFIAVDETQKDKFKASMICADKKGPAAAIVIVALDIPQDQMKSAEAQVDNAEKIIKSIKFP